MRFHSITLTFVLLTVAACQTVPEVACVAVVADREVLPKNTYSTDIAGQVSGVAFREVLPKPGIVFVNVSTRDASAEELYGVCRQSGQKPKPIVGVRAPSGYGLDDRFQSVGIQVMRMGSGCLGGDAAQCRAIVETLHDWARADAGIVESVIRSQLSDDTLTVNLRVVRPFIGAYSVARARGFGDETSDAEIHAWMRRVLNHASRLQRDKGVYRSPDGAIARWAASNHPAASAAAWMAYGAQWNDPEALQHGLDQWFITLGSMRSDGSLPIETRRGASAIFYQGRTMSALASIAVMAEMQGIDLWAKSPEPDKTFHRAASFMLEALVDKEVVFPYARDNDIPGPDKDWRNQYLGGLSNTLGWVLPYMNRFPGRENSARILGADGAEGWATASLASFLRKRSAVGEWLGVDGVCFFCRSCLAGH